MSTAATPRLASSGDWDAYRTTIIDLYQSQGKTLKEVSTIMQNEHGFRGTPKTYKTHFEKWGVQKSFRSKQVAQILHQKTARDAAGKATKVLIRGKEVPDKRLKTYIRRTTKTPRIQDESIELNATGVSGANHGMVPVVLCRTPSPVPSGSPQFALVSSSSVPPMNDYLQYDPMILFEQPSKHSTAFPSAPSIAEQWEPFQSSPPMLYDRQAFSESLVSVDAPEDSQPLQPVLSCRRSSASPAISQLFPLAMPDRLEKPEECIYLVRDYVSERFDSGSWGPQNFLEGQWRVIEWYNRAKLAILLLDQGHNKQAFRILDRCFRQFKELSVTPSYKLFSNTCLLILESTSNYADLAAAFITHARDMSHFTLKQHHPYGKLLEKMCLIDIMDLHQSLRSILDCYSEYLETKIGSKRGPMIELTISRCYADSMLDWGGLLDFSVTESRMKKSLQEVKQYGDLARSKVLDIKWYLADFYYQNDRFDEARSIVSDILASINVEWDYDLEIAESCYRLLFRISRQVGSHDEIVSSMDQWMSFAKAYFGQEDRYIGALSAWEAYLRTIKDMDRAEETFQEFDTAVEELCVDFEEFLDLDKDEDV